MRVQTLKDPTFIRSLVILDEAALYSARKKYWSIRQPCGKISQLNRWNGRYKSCGPGKRNCMVVESHSCGVRDNLPAPWLEESKRSLEQDLKRSNRTEGEFSAQLLHSQHEDDILKTKFDVFEQKSLQVAADLKWKTRSAYTRRTIFTKNSCYL